MTKTKRKPEAVNGQIALGPHAVDSVAPSGPAVSQPLLKLDFGAGMNPREGFESVDRLPFDGKVKHVVDLCEREAWVDGGYRHPFKPWPWPDSSVTEAHASHFLEHLTNFDDRWERVWFFNELYRVLVPGGQCQIIIPHWCSTRYYGDPTHCFSEDTEILTESGWKSFTNVRVGERVPALNLETETTHLTPVAQVIDRPYVGEMLHFKTVRMDLLVTPNHDIVWRAKGGNGGYWRRKGQAEPRPKLRKSAADTFVGMGGHHPRCGLGVFPWAGESPPRISVTEGGQSVEFDAGDFAELVGWFVSEGHTWIDGNRSCYRVTISQCPKANYPNVCRIVELLRRMGFRPCITGHQVSFSSKLLAQYFQRLGHCSEKYVPAAIKVLSPPLLQRFLDAALLGDGRVNNKGWEYATTSTRLADDIQEIAAKAGYRTSSRLDRQAGKKLVIGGCETTARYDLHMVGISPPTDMWYPQPERVRYAGRIVCVTLADHHNVYVRRNGKPMWSGNCEPMSEFAFLYLSRFWRLGDPEKGIPGNAPHTDVSHNPQMYSCDFGFTSSYVIHPALGVRAQEYVQHAIDWWKEAAQDLIVMLTSQKKA